MSAGAAGRRAVAEVEVVTVGPIGSPVTLLQPEGLGTSQDGAAGVKASRGRVGVAAVGGIRLARVEERFGERAERLKHQRVVIH